MANLRALRSRIRSIESTGQLTKSMKTVSVSKLRRMQSAMQALRPFAETCRDMLTQVTAEASPDNEFFRCREQTGKICYVLFVGNRGLCGAYNQQLVTFFKGLPAPDGAFLVVCGRWGRETIASCEVPIRKIFDTMPDTPSSEDARELSEYLKELYRTGEADRIELVYNAFKNILVQEPTVQTLLPLLRPETENAPAQIIFEPDRKTLTDTLTELYISNTVYAVMLEARTGEHASRVSAMSAASDNTDELIAKLSLEVNRARQSAITTELSEVAGGAAALEQFRS